MTIKEATGLPVRRHDEDPRSDDPTWREARERALRLAEEHFESRGDVSFQIVTTFVHRETCRALGEPIPRLWYGWGRTMRGQVVPKLTPRLQAVLDAQEARRWQTA